MNISSSPPITPTNDCACGTGQTPSEIECPTCGKRGATVRLITPKHTVKKTAQHQVIDTEPYSFCDNPDCNTVYYSESGSSVITTDELKNRVTLKDDSPETPLCYCFKVLKKQALEEIARTGTTDVFRQIQEKMKPGQSCFCEKSNPRGDTCVKDIKSWVKAQGIDVIEPGIEKPTNSCCG